MMPFAATWMDRDVIIPGKVGQRQQHVMPLTGGIYSVAGMNLSVKQEQTRRCMCQTWDHLRGKGGIS